MYIFAWLLVLMSFISVFVSWRYFRIQKEKCKKYPFFKFRDKVIYEIVTQNNYNQYQDIYEKSNWVIERLDHFDFRFYSDVMTMFFDEIIEEAYKNDWVIDDSFIEMLRKNHKPTPLIKEFAQIILDTARTNSFLLRVFMTKFGYRLFFTHHAFKAANRFVNRHPEFFKKRRSEVITIRNYAYINQLAPAL